LLRLGGALTAESGPVRTVDAAEERSALCRSVLETLPDWFGLPEAIDRYVQDVAELPVLAVDDVGSSRRGPLRHRGGDLRHGRCPRTPPDGMGTALVEAAEDLLRGTGIEYLQVKTLGPSRPDEHHAATRRFYEAAGFGRSRS
jgi:hypothetical protein